ncbi:vegetative cell wall protein gp1 [Oryza sativa Japonica Group]|uniref:vegetative cell wall protein gp1 n=1 Tax=Oryza sativa subsp. japonica TaxID=39947 RepID=UPI0007754A41|nr:vegetative cell wall protein gp1 [Oryza sativa Japonica Group]XP_015611011.1 vegetative cell wall protein gp1 [Oryza sativa Japonica Group]XP_025875955.1 vegetative cell wall protein gp1 [Oryza sativa Japonica Group]
MPSALATHVPTPPAPAPPVPTPLAPTPADVPPGFTMSPTITRYSFGYDGASSSSAMPRMRTTLALCVPAPHPRVPRAPAPPVPAPPAPTPPIPTPPALAPPADVPPGFTVSPATTRYSFGYGGASSSSAMPHATTAPLALRAPAPHLCVSRMPPPLVPTPPAHAPPVATPPTLATPVPTPPVTAPPADVPPGFTVSPTTTHYSFGYGGASLSSAMPRAAAAPLVLRGPAPHLRVSRMPAPPIPMPPAPAPPIPTPSMPFPTVPAPPVTVPPATAPSMAAPAAASHGLTVSPTMTRYSFGYGGASSPSAVPCTSSVTLALRALTPHLRALRVSVPRPRAPSASAPPAAAPREWTVSLTTGRYSFGDSGASSSSAAPRAPAAPLALHAPAPHIRAPSMAAPPPAAPRGRTMPPTTGRYSFSYGGLSLSYTTPRGPIAPLSLRSPAPHLRARRVPTAPPAAARPRAPTPPAAAAAPAAPPAPPSGLPSWPLLVRPPTGPARARLAPATPTEAFEEYLVQRRAIEATVDDTPWEMIGRSRKTGGPMFAVAGGGRDRAELEAKEARERRKNRMDKRKAAAAARAQQPPPPLAPRCSGELKWW